MKYEEAKEEVPIEKGIPVEQLIEAQFAKIGKLVFEIELMGKQMTALEHENKQLKSKLGMG